MLPGKIRTKLLVFLILQTHIEPVPEFIIKNALRNLNLKKQDFFNILFDCDPAEVEKSKDKSVKPD